MADDGCDRYEWRCGDKCIHYGASCNCGNTTLAISSESWCCGAGCAKDGRGATCPTGTVQPLTQPCHGQCNHHAQDRKRNYVGVRSHLLVRCDHTTICLPEQVCRKWDDDNRCRSHAPSLCIGSPPVCADGQDIQACSHTCDMEHRYGFSTYQCNGGACISANIPGVSE